MLHEKVIFVAIVIFVNIQHMNTRKLSDGNSNRKLKLIHIDSDISIEPKRETEEQNQTNEVQKTKKADEEENYNQTYKDTNDTEVCVGAKRYCNMTEEDYITMMKNYIYPKPFEWVLISIHSVVFVLGLVGNALVCVAVYINRNRDMQSITNIFIVNLAVADFMVILFCLPATVAWDVTKTWWLGEVLCKLLVYFQSVSVTVSVLTLTVISVDRWYKFCFPLRSRCTKGRARARARASILVIWLIALCFNAPELVVLTVVVEIPLRFNLRYLLQCAAVWSDDPDDRSDFVWHIVKILFNYSIPLLLMTVAYCQIVRELWNNSVPGNHEQTRLMARRKASKMLVAVVIMFAVCFFPVHLLSLLRYSDVRQTDLLTILGLISHLLCYANSAINPLIYNFMSETFRKAFCRAIGCQWSSSPVHESFTTLTRVTSRFNSQNRSCKRQDNNSTAEPQVHYKSSSYRSIEPQVHYESSLYVDSSCKSVL